MRVSGPLTRTLLAAILVQAVVPWSLDLADFREALRTLAVKAGCEPSATRATISGAAGAALISIECETVEPSE